MWIEAEIPCRWDEAGRFTPDVGSVPVIGTSPPCGKKREKSSTRLSTGKGNLQPNPHLGEIQMGRLYVGVWILRDFEDERYFSTAKGIYPQIIASYPHLPCLDKDFRRIPRPKYGSYFYLVRANLGESLNLIHKQRLGIPQNRQRIRHKHIKKGTHGSQLLAETPYQ